MSAPKRPKECQKKKLNIIDRFAQISAEVSIEDDEVEELLGAANIDAVTAYGELQKSIEASDKNKTVILEKYLGVVVRLYGHEGFGAQLYKIDVNLPCRILTSSCAYDDFFMTDVSEPDLPWVRLNARFELTRGYETEGSRKKKFTKFEFERIDRGSMHDPFNPYDRDPRKMPREGDVVYQANGTRMLIIDKVTDDEVDYRVTDREGGLLDTYKITLSAWRESAPYTCDLKKTR